MINLTSRYPAILALLFLIISAAVSFYFYKNIPLQRIKKYFLISLKTLAIFLILVLLIEPSLLAVLSKNNEPLDLILVDNSRSNELLNGNGETKSTVINKLLEKNIFQRSNYKIFTLSDSLNRPELISGQDSIKFNTAETDMSGALNKLITYFPDKNFASVTIISDGIFNAGGNPVYPARKFQVPFITIGIGDTLQREDVVLSDVFFDDKAFTETNNIIRVHINSFELSGESLTIDLLREGVVIQSKEINVTHNQQTDELEFTVREANPGIVKYSIVISNIDGELTFKNNKEQFLIHYIDNKTNILFISAGPGYDNTAVLDVLKRVNNFNLTERTVKSANEFYEGSIDLKHFGEYSIVFLLGFPIPQFRNEITSQIASKVKEHNIPVIFFAQKNTDYKKLEMFDRSIPFTLSRFNQSENEFNPLVVSAADNVFSDVQGDINSEPPIFKNISGIIQKSGSTALMTDKLTGEPVFITRNDGKTKSSAFLGYGLWRWSLNSKPGKEKTLENFIIESVNLTLLHDKVTKFKVYPVKDIFDYSENIKIEAEVYDDEYKPVRNANVTAKILSNNGSVTAGDIKFNYAENKFYAAVSRLPFGDYIIEGDAEINNNAYASDKSRFLVDSVNTEYLVTKSNFESLKELSQNTGGKFFTAESDESDISNAYDTISEQDIKTGSPKIKKHYNLWENKYILIFIIFLFSVEWILRKRNNLP